MRQFIPFEDEWDMLESLGPDALIPFHIDLSCERGTFTQPAQRTGASRVSTVNVSPTEAPMRLTVPAGTSRA